MMDFFTHFYRKNKRISWLILLSLGWLSISFSPSSFAANSAITIKQAELVSKEEIYKLNADLDIVFSTAIEDAINKGVPLTFLIEFQVVSPRKYWFDDEVVTLSTRVSLSYHALSRQYLINRSNHQLTFASLQDAKDELAKLRDWSVLDKSMLKKGEAYNAALRVRLDQSLLPKPLQVEALSSDDWDMVSERYHWTPQFNL